MTEYNQEYYEDVYHRAKVFMEEDVPEDFDMEEFERRVVYAKANNPWSAYGRVPENYYFDN